MTMETGGENTKKSAELDPSTLSNPNQVMMTNLNLDLKVDFEQSSLSGFVDITAKIIDKDATVLLLDTRGLVISSVTVNDVESTFESKPSSVKQFGSALSVPLPSNVSSQNDTFHVKIGYKTTADSSALQWLSPAQTLTGTHPYLFTQCQAIHARSLVPCQDTPMVKCTYTARIHVPSPLVALMSAVSSGEPVRSGNMTVYSFKQTVPIPLYLLALAVGLLEKRDIGPRSAVWAEKGVVDKAAYEFEDTEKFLKAAETICGPYVWGRYDLLCLPPSFPYGGMENPCLTFVTPTLLAGDKSLANVVAHEIAHSWTGNLVTNRTWEHFWLNEGFTVYVERKIGGLIHGDEHFHFQAVLGLKHLQDSIDHFGATNPLTKLCPDLKGIDPDDAFSSVPYEKGFNLLYFLETRFGRKRFEAFLRAWISANSFKTVTTDMFVNAVKQEFGDDQSVDWNAWLFSPGMPPVQPSFDMTLHKAVNLAAEQWLEADWGNKDSLLQWPCTKSISGFTSSQQIAFLDRLLMQKKVISAEAVKALQSCEAFNFAKSRNAEIRFRFYTLCIAVELESIIPNSVAFLVEQGRMKFVRPLYRALYQSKMGRDVARKTFLDNRNIYHSIAAKMIERDLELSS